MNISDCSYEQSELFLHHFPIHLFYLQFRRVHNKSVWRKWLHVNICPEAVSICHTGFTLRHFPNTHIPLTSYSAGKLSSAENSYFTYYSSKPCLPFGSTHSQRKTIRVCFLNTFWSEMIKVFKTCNKRHFMQRVNYRQICDGKHCVRGESELAAVIHAIIWLDLTVIKEALVLS